MTFSGLRRLIGSRLGLYPDMVASSMRRAGPGFCLGEELMELDQVTGRFGSLARLVVP
jgi:hypothetical protein